MEPNNRSARCDAIINAAAEEFSASGFERTKMEVIARRAGIGKSTVYEYFPSKTELLRAVAEQMQGLICTRSKDILRGDAPFREKLIRHLELISRLMAHISTTGMVLQRSDPAFKILHEHGRQSYELLHVEMLGAVKDAQQRGEIAATVDVEAAALLLIGLPTPPMAMGFSSGVFDSFEPIVDLLLNGMVS